MSEGSVNLRELAAQETAAHNSGNLGRFDELYTEGYVDHGMGTSGREEFKEAYVDLKKAFPDLTLTIEDTVVEGDRIAVRGTVRGTHRGEFMGIAPTGRAIEVTDLSIKRAEGGRLAEAWGAFDAITLLQQLSVIGPQQGER